MTANYRFLRKSLLIVLFARIDFKTWRLRNNRTRTTRYASADKLIRINGAADDGSLKPRESHQNQPKPAIKTVITA